MFLLSGAGGLGGEKLRYGFFQLCAGLGNGIEHWLAEGFAELEVSCAYSEQQSRAGQGTVEFAGELQQLWSAYVVGGERLRAAGCFLTEVTEIGAGRGCGGAIDKEDRLGAGNVFGEFGSPLVAADDFDGWLVLKAVFGPIGKPGADAIVAAEGVAAGQDEADWLRLESSMLRLLAEGAAKLAKDEVPLILQSLGG